MLGRRTRVTEVGIVESILPVRVVAATGLTVGVHPVFSAASPPNSRSQFRSLSTVTEEIWSTLTQEVGTG
jgi:hypothetical protein